MFRFAMPLVILAACAANAALPQKTATSDDAKIAKQLAGLSAGKPRNCIARDQMGTAKGFPGTILYVEGRNKVWRNDVTGTCTGLARDDIMVVESMGRDLCRGDVVSTRSRVGGMRTGSCVLGQFTPYGK